MSGWIKIHRQLMENPLYHSEPFNRTHAWIDLLLLANHKENFFYKRGIRVDVGCGQVGHDVDTLAKRWKWSRGKVERFLNQLENDNMIARQKNNVTTLISISKYADYQEDDKANSKPNSKPNGHQTVNQTDTNKNEENYKNEKNNTYRRFSHLEISQDEFQKLVDAGWVQQDIDRILDDIENYAGNKKYKSLYLTAKNWLKDTPKRSSLPPHLQNFVF